MDSTQLLGGGRRAGLCADGRRLRAGACVALVNFNICCAMGAGGVLLAELLLEVRTAWDFTYERFYKRLPQ